jgi:hypothetical protein
VAEFGKDLKVTPRAAAKIEDRKRPFTLDVLQQRRDILANVVKERSEITLQAARDFLENIMVDYGPQELLCKLSYTSNSRPANQTCEL